MSTPVTNLVSADATEEDARQLEMRAHAYRDEATATLEKDDQPIAASIATTAERIAAAMRAGDTAAARLGTLAFSRQVSDTLFRQPSTYRALSDAVWRVRDLLTR